MIPFLQILIVAFAVSSLSAAAGQVPGASYYPYRLVDDRAIYFEKPTFSVHADGIGDDAPALQEAVNRAQEAGAAGVVFIPQGRYRLAGTVNVWRGIRLIGFGSERPVFVLADRTPGFDKGSGNYMIHFCNFRPKPGQPIEDARGETFFSGISNINIEIGEGNSEAVAVRFHVAQLSSLSHMDFHIGSAKSGVEAIGNQIEDCRFFGGDFGILTGKTAPGWPSLVLDCYFEGQRKAGIETNEAGMTAIRDRFRNSPYGIVVTEKRNERLFVKDSSFEQISNAGILISNYSDPNTQVHVESARGMKTPVFLAFRDTETPENLRQFPANAPAYMVTRFSHGLEREGLGDDEQPRVKTSMSLAPVKSPADIPAKDHPDLPDRESWANIVTLGAKGDGVTDDTARFKQAIANYRTIYIPIGRYRLTNTLTLKPESVLVGMNPQATELVVLSSEQAFSDPAHPRPVIETAKGGRNIVTGIGVEPGHNKGAIAIKWTAGEQSYLDDVYLPWTDRTVPKGSAQYLGLWVTDGGGGTFKNLWFPDALAQDGFRVTNTSTPSRVYEASVEHHVNAEITMRNVANWTWYALQTEENEGSDETVSADMDECNHISFVNYFIYRMPKTPFPYAIRLRRSSNVTFQHLHNFHWRGLAFDTTLFDPDKRVSVAEHELSYLNVK
jgi:hypothetical protein